MRESLSADIETTVKPLKSGLLSTDLLSGHTILGDAGSSRVTENRELRRLAALNDAPPLLAVRIQANYLTSLNLNFLTCKTQVGFSPSRGLWGRNAIS